MEPTVNAAPAAPASNTTPASGEQTAAASKSPAPVVKVDENGVAPDAPKKIWKLKVNGKEVEYDATDEAKLQRDIQKIYGIEEKAKTAAEKSDQAETLLNLIQTDPVAFAKRCKTLGIDADKLAIEILWKKTQYDKMTPEQRELEEYKEREREATEKKQADDEAAKVAAVNQKTQEWAKKFEDDCTKALTENKVPNTRLSLALIAQYIDAGLADEKTLTVNDVIPYVARDLKEIHTSTMGRLSGEALLDYIGEELSNKIAKARVDRYKKSQAVTEPVKKVATNPNSNNGVDLSKLKGKAYWAALRKTKSEEGIGFYPGRQ